ncbi:polysaccharide deacetylase family protein [Halobacillus kuroshimensis]|uniref:Polysaccharide deacetylase family protein n=1 Tax=Halobacillus kuroshimensis TaxID=302481 RepID=A0ABS3DXW2_9BACI|nr:polysaccharide deacetylase family protein [Halobacillus kuroshimensis]MBN8236159.1 polysaccharide deacetylase family protein [Halobacillus kuroshimensis]
MRQPILYISLLVVLVVSGCSFIAKANENDSKQSDETEPMYDIDMKTELVEHNEYHITIHYPQTTNNQLNQTIVDYVNQQKAGFKQASYQNKQSVEASESHELHVDFEMLYQDHRFFVVRFIETMDVGGNEVIQNQTVMNFDKKDGRRLELDELLNNDPEVLDELAALTEEALKEEVSTRYSLPLHVNKGTFEDVALTKEGVRVYLQAEDGTLGYVLVELEEGQDLIRKEFVEALESASDVSEPSSSEQKQDREGPVEAVSTDDLGVETGEKRAALTFDDGPHPTWTVDILDLLEKYDAKGSFFMIGKRVSYYPETARMVAEQGHEIGNHTWDHPRLARLNPEEVDEQILAAQDVIKQAAGVETAGLRLPFGEEPPMAYKGDWNTVPWTLYSEEWSEHEPEEIAEEITSQAEDGSVILLHELESRTPEVVELVLEQLTSQGFQFVKVSDLQT